MSLRIATTATAFATLLGASAAAPAPQISSASADSRLRLKPCVVGRSKTPARCGTFVVFEDRAAQSGRTIPLKLVVVPAKIPLGRAMFWNPGGPGASSVEQTPFIVHGLFAKPFKQLNDRADIVFVDARGTGGSAPLTCDLYPPAQPAPYFAQLWVSRAFATAVRSDKPILMLSGADDPASPPQFGREALRYLPNARQILIPNASHEIELPCTDKLIVSFVRSRSAKNLDTEACAGSYHRPPFATTKLPPGF